MKRTAELWFGVWGLFAFSAVFAERLQAGAWVREKGEAYSKLSIQRFGSDQIFDSKGNRKLPGPDYEEISTGFYGEYGLTPKWTGVLSLAHKSIDYTTPAVDTRVSGLTDLWVYAKRSLLNGPFVLSGQFGIKIPLGYDEANVPPLGDGQVDLEGKILLGKSFHPFAGYGNIEVGYRKRNGDFSDEIPYAVEAGVNPLKSTLLKLTLSGTTNRINDAAGQSGFTSSNPNVFDKEHMKLGVSLGVSVSRGFSVEAYYETHLSGANTALGDTVGIGLSWQGRRAQSTRP